MYILDLYQKLLNKGARVVSFQSTFDFHVLTYEDTTYGFKVYEEEDHEGNTETSYTLKNIILNRSSSLPIQGSYLFGTTKPAGNKFEAVDHVMIYNNVVMLREKGLNNQDTQIFLRRMQNKYLLTPEDIRQFEHEGFKVLVTI